MTVVICLLAALVAVAALGLWFVLRVYFEYKGTRIITCPETKRPTAVLTISQILFRFRQRTWNAIFQSRAR